MRGIFSLEIGEFCLWRTVGLCEIMFLRSDRLPWFGHDVCWSCLLFSGEGKSQLIRVLVVDEDDLSREAAYSIVDVAVDMTVVAETADEQEMLDLVSEFQPDVVLMGVGTPHSDHLRAVEQLHSLRPESEILMTGTYAESPLLLEALKKGARGYLEKGSGDPLEVVKSIRIVSEGGTVLSPGLTGLLFEALFENR